MRETQGTARTDPVIFCCGKTAAATPKEVAVAFLFPNQQNISF